ncbi:MAG: 50S ribosomal protein L17 [bacterium]
MRHGDRVKKLGRKREHRIALVKGLVAALIKYERIKTTVAKAKLARQMAERLVHQALTGTLASRRQVARLITDKRLVNKLFAEIAPRMADRQGGYLRIYRLGHRPGDSAEMAFLEFVVRSEKEKPKKEKKGGKKAARGSRTKKEASGKKTD